MSPASGPSDPEAGRYVRAIGSNRTGTNRMQQSTASGLNALAGAWLVAAPLVLDYEEATPGWNDIAVGLAVALVGVLRASWLGSMWWYSLINVALGVWLIAAPFVLSYDDSTPTWNDVVLGGVIAFLATWSTLAGLVSSRMPVTDDAR